MHFDLRGHRPGHPGQDFFERLPGITLAPPLFFKGSQADLSRPAKYFMTFRGSLRPNLGQGEWHPRVVIDKVSRKISEPGVVLEFIPAVMDALQGGLSILTKNDTSRYMDLMDTSYALMLRGVDRWTYRFSEAIGACAIPVFLADGRDFGLTLPFEELVDWRKVTINLAERMGYVREHILLM